MLGTLEFMTSDAAYSASYVGGLSSVFRLVVFACFGFNEECVDDVTGVTGDVTGGRATIKGGLKSSGSS